MKALLTVKGLHAGYGAGDVLHDVSFEVEKGSVTTLLGANGAGKSTLLRAVCGMIRSRGDMRIDAKPLTGMRTEDIVRLGVAHVPEGRGTFHDLTVDENLHLGATARADTSEFEADVERMFGYFPILKQRRWQQAGTLSGGEQQMLAVSRALMLRPRLMLLDEPSFGLAPLLVRELFEILRTVNAKEKVTMLLVEQNAALALGLADMAYVLETGKIVMRGTAAEVRADEGVRRAYLGQ